MWRPWFILRPVNVESLVDTLAMEQDFSEYFVFFPTSIVTPLLHSPPQCYIILATDILIHFKMSIS